MKWLKIKSSSGTYSVGISGMIISCGVSQLHILTAPAKGQFIETVWNMVDPTCSNAEWQQRDLKPRKLSRSKDQVK